MSVDAVPLPRVREALRLGTEQADRKRAAEEQRRAKAAARGKAAPPPLGPDLLELSLPVFRGAGLGLVEQLAAPLGWQLDWKRGRTARLETAHLSRQPAGADRA